MQPLIANFVAAPNLASTVEATPLPMLNHFFAEMFGGQLVAVVAVVGGLSLAVIITVSALFFQHRKRQMWHETARIALEKGQPLPSMPVTDEEMESRPPPGVSFAEWQQARRSEARRHDLKGGLVLIGVGLGLGWMLPPGNGGVGAIPGLIGVALIVSALIERFSSPRHPPAGGRPPQP